MSENENKKKKRFTVQSPYSDYAEDNDMITDMMHTDEEEQNVIPDKKAIISSALTALALVVVFAVMALLVSAVGSCIGTPAAQ